MTLRARLLRYLWPRSLFGRLAVILISGFAATHAISLMVLARQRAESEEALLTIYDIVTAVRVLGPAWETWMWAPLTISAVLIAALTWMAVGQATRPLARLAEAADALGSDLRVRPLREDGPTEVARAAAAFNTMQRRIADHLSERMRILAAISHDLRTPITRMRLRIDLLENAALREKMHADLQQMQALVEEGLAYAQSAQAVNEPLCRIDHYALLDSLACDYADAGQPIRVIGHFDGTIVTRPNTLRRVITNLLDNALKFGTDVELALENESVDRIVIAVRDRGPGIPEAELQAVLQPFYRLEASRNRDTGGTGLGLAIAHQLTLALVGTLSLSNRAGGGLEARLSLPLATEFPVLESAPPSAGAQRLSVNV